METIGIDKKLIDGYLELLRNLSRDSKLDLISKLSESLKSEKKNKTSTLDFFAGEFIPEKNADEIINDLKEARNFKRSIESF